MFDANRKPTPKPKTEWFATWFHDKRIQLRHSQKDFAEMLQIDQSAASQYEVGTREPTLYQFEKILKALGGDLRRALPDYCPAQDIICTVEHAEPHDCPPQPRRAETAPDDSEEARVRRYLGSKIQEARRIYDRLEQEVDVYDVDHSGAVSLAPIGKIPIDLKQLAEMLPLGRQIQTPTRLLRRTANRHQCLMVEYYVCGGYDVAPVHNGSFVIYKTPGHNEPCLCSVHPSAVYSQRKGWQVHSAALSPDLMRYWQLEEHRVQELCVGTVSGLPVPLTIRTDFS